MNAKFKLTENEISAIMAQREATIAPYRSLAVKIANTVAAGKKIGEKAKEGRQSLWDNFKAAIVVASEAHHSAAAMTDGLSLACDEAKVPAGSYRSYVATASALLAKVSTGTLTVEAAKALTITNARQLVMTGEAKQLAELQKRFKELTKEYGAAEWAALIELIAPEQGEETEEEAETTEVAKAA